MHKYKIKNVTKYTVYVLLANYLEIIKVITVYRIVFSPHAGENTNHLLPIKRGLLRLTSFVYYEPLNHSTNPVVWYFNIVPFQEMFV